MSPLNPSSPSIPTDAPHYGGSGNPYEAIKVINAWGLGFELGNTLKYICRAGKKPGESELKDLKKAAWYLNHHIDRVEAQLFLMRKAAARPP